MKLRLFCPAEEWRLPIDVDSAQLPLLEAVAKRLEEPFRISGDKVFLGRRGDATLRPPAPAPVAASAAPVADLHLVVSGPERSAKLFAAGGAKLFDCEARCEGQAGTLDPGNGQRRAKWDVQNGDTPPGDYQIIRVERIPRTDPQWAALGRVYFWLKPISGAAAAIGDVGVGGHGGGSNLADPWALRQGWLITHGCVRFQNEDILHLADLVEPALAAGHKAVLTVLQE